MDPVSTRHPAGLAVLSFDIRCREKVEDLQNEITKVEKDYRTQIAMQEKKAHENWVIYFTQMSYWNN